MTDKLTGPAEAAREIDKLQEEWFCRQITSREPNREERASTIEAIILKHCPQDKAVDGLVEALKAFVDAFGKRKPERMYTRNGTYSFPDVVTISTKIAEIARTALAEYEKVKK